MRNFKVGVPVISSPEWLYKDAVFEELGSGQPTAAYRRFVESGNDDETERFYTKNQWPAIRGSKRFAEKAYLYSNSKKVGVRRERSKRPVDTPCAETR